MIGRIARALLTTVIFPAVFAILALAIYPPCGVYAVIAYRRSPVDQFGLYLQAVGASGADCFREIVQMWRAI